MITNRPTRSILLLLMLTILVFMVNVFFGSVNIPVKEVIMSLTGQEVEQESWNYIIQNYRLPKAVTAVLVGSGLGVSGLLMQTLFRNPLAGPFVLGISSGASLGVATLVMGSALMGGVLGGLGDSKWGIII
ncbi:MAG: iron ABC transporter permease, partial [Bacteroidia bacterium]|nr:iron ABC transporter permease [Bacteroidia bacterium]